MLTPDDYRQLAERCVLLAFECATPGIAEELRTLALDYLTRAVSQMGRGSDEPSLMSGTCSVNAISEALSQISLLESLRLACEGT